MPLSPEQLEEMRSWVGTIPTDDELQARWERLQSYNAVIEETIRIITNDLARRPASVTVPGGLSISSGENLRYYQDLLKRFQAGQGMDEDPLAGVSGPGSTTRLVRSDWR